MKKVISVFVCLFLTACGTFTVKLEVVPPGVETAPVLPTVALAPVPSATSAAPAPTVPATATATESAVAPLQLTAIQMHDALNGWGVEAEGRILKTSDGGGLWRNVTPFQGRFDSHSLLAFNAETAWVVPAQLEVRNLIWRTQDGGRTWEGSQPLALGASQYRPLSLQFPDARHGWLLVLAEADDQTRSVLLFKSEDGGENWVQVSQLAEPRLQSYLPTTMTSMTFLDGQTGWIGGWWGQETPNQWVILKTSDGGANWALEALRLPAYEALQCNGSSLAELAPGSMAVDLTCTLPSDPKYLYHRAHYLSTEIGSEWHSWVLPGQLLSVSFLNARQGWMMVPSANPHLNQVLATRDGGGSWDQVSLVAWKQAQFEFVSAKIGWAIVGNGFETALVRTENGGQVWIQVRPALINP